MPDADRRHLAVRHPCCARSGRGHRPTWSAKYRGQRSWRGILPDGDPVPVPTHDWHCIAPGKPMRTGFIDSFNGRFRDEILNEALFSNLGDARVQIADWQDDHNRPGPHSAIANTTPTEFAMIMRPEKPAASARKSTRGRLDLSLFPRPCVGGCWLQRARSYIRTASSPIRPTAFCPASSFISPIFLSAVSMASCSAFSTSSLFAAAWRFYASRCEPVAVTDPGGTIRPWPRQTTLRSGLSILPCRRGKLRVHLP